MNSKIMSDGELMSSSNEKLKGIAWEVMYLLKEKDLTYHEVLVILAICEGSLGNLCKLTDYQRGKSDVDFSDK